MMNVKPKADHIPFGNADRLFIDGKWVEPSSSARIDLVAPATEQIFVSVAAAREADIERAVHAARQAFDRGPWPRMTHGERASVLKTMGQLATERAEDVAELSRKGTSRRAVEPSDFWPASP